MQLGKVVFNFEYVVDLGNERMVDQAYNWIIDDVEMAVKNNDITGYIVEQTDTEGILQEFQIPPALMTYEEEDE
jgi:hypothetical protein